ncbi:hypothetical protein Y032_0431g1338 [Ancylostoma ceylanicum]|uniref:Uncharacterized protein n=1 Tax=Ancylostoma ceylanicum TaxID=53326 RepID=A0A016X1G9_9BILA|nr:hypothetical protein Y032_0431g1338 [Ancylostoma ceylanicum]
MVPALIREWSCYLTETQSKALLILWWLFSRRLGSIHDDVMLPVRTADGGDRREKMFARGANGIQWKWL